MIDKVKALLQQIKQSVDGATEENGALALSTIDQDNNDPLLAAMSLIASNAMSTKQNNHVTFGDDIDKYARCNFPMGTDPIQYWAEKMDIVPHLAQVALAYVTIPACVQPCDDSVLESDRVFAAAFDGEDIEELVITKLNLDGNESLIKDITENV